VIDPTARMAEQPSSAPIVPIDAGVEIGADFVTLLPACLIYRGVNIGKTFFAHSHVSVRENCEMGDNVLLTTTRVGREDGVARQR